MTKTQLKLYLEFMLIKYNNDNKKGLWYNSITNNDYWLVKALLEDGYDIHEYYEWGLKCACEYEHYKIARLLIYYGADIDEALYWAKKPPPDLKVIKWLEKYKNKI